MENIYQHKIDMAMEDIWKILNKYSIAEQVDIWRLLRDQLEKLGY